MGRPLRVLIVEDVPADAELMILALGSCGLEPTFERVETADELRAALATGPWDAVLSDYTLPGFGATAALEVVRASDPDLPFIVVSGSIGEDVAVGLLRVGANDYILKHNLTRLAPAVSREVREAENRRAVRAGERTIAHLAAIVESSDDAIISESLNGVITTWNPAAERLYGWTAAEVIGRNVSFLVPPDKADEFTVIMGRLQAGEKIESFESVRMHRAGPRIDVSLTISPIRDSDGRRIGVSKIARDIRERKRVEGDLCRTADLLHAVVEGTIDAVFVKDREGRYLLFNEAAAQFVGRSVKEVLGNDDTSLFNPIDAGRVMAQDHSIMQSGRTETTEEVLTAAGVTRTYLATNAPYRDDQGQIIGVVGIARDITDRRRLAAERDELLARLTLQVERMPLAYLLTGPDYRYTRWNPAAERMFGFTEAEVLGKHPSEIIIPSQSQALVAVIFARLAKGDMNAHGMCENLTKDGRTIFCEWYNTPLFSPGGTFLGILSLAQDVTARQSAAEALLLRDRAIQAVTQGILITDPGQSDNPIIFVSPGFERITGYGSQEALGRNCRFLQGKDTDPAATAQLREATQTEQSCTVELLNYRKDGTAFWNELSISPVRDAGGRLTHFVGVQADVTERRKLEDQYRQAQKMEAFGQLAGGVAHDFNNLLTVINGYSDMLVEELPSTDRRRASAVEIRGAGERAAGLTAQLLAFSRKTIVEPKILDLNALVDQTGQMLQRLIGEDITFTTELAPALGRVKADQGQIEQVIMNLAVNARDAMPKGGRLTIATKNTEVLPEDASLAADPPPSSYVQISVSDTGTGMTDEVKAKIFEPFYTTKGVGKGTGLGLATVYGIVKQAGGQIIVSSVVGVGTTFSVVLPAVIESLSRPMPVALAPPTRGTETILLVEDEQAVRKFVRLALQTRGYKLLEAVDGAEAIRVIEEHDGPIHLLITDVVLPGMGGRDLAEAIRILRIGVRVLFMSGYTDDAIVRHGVVEATDAFVQKPFTPVALARMVRAVLDETA